MDDKGHGPGRNGLSVDDQEAPSHGTRVRHNPGGLSILGDDPTPEESGLETTEIERRVDGPPSGGETRRVT